MYIFEKEHPLNKTYKEHMEKLVPTSGEASTVEGEFLREINRILYDLDNNGGCNILPESYLANIISNFNSRIVSLEFPKQCQNFINNLLKLSQLLEEGKDIEDVWETEEYEVDIPCPECSGDDNCSFCDGTGYVIEYEEEDIGNKYEEFLEEKLAPVLRNLIEDEIGKKNILEAVFLEVLRMEREKENLKNNSYFNIDEFSLL